MAALRKLSEGAWLMGGMQAGPSWNGCEEWVRGHICSICTRYWHMRKSNDHSARLIGEGGNTIARFPMGRFITCVRVARACSFRAAS